MLGVVLRQTRAIRGEDGQGHKGVALGLDPAQHLTRETTPEAVGLDQDQRAFNLCRHSSRPYPSGADASCADVPCPDVSCPGTSPAAYHVASTRLTCSSMARPWTRAVSQSTPNISPTSSIMGTTKA